MTELKVFIEMLIQTKTQHEIFPVDPYGNIPAYFPTGFKSVTVGDTGNYGNGGGSFWIFDQEGKFLGVGHYDG